MRRATGSGRKAERERMGRSTLPARRPRRESGAVLYEAGRSKRCDRAGRAGSSALIRSPSARFMRWSSGRRGQRLRPCASPDLVCPTALQLLPRHDRCGLLESGEAACSAAQAAGGSVAQGSGCRCTPPASRNEPEREQHVMALTRPSPGGRRERRCLRWPGTSCW
ncbi:hypothetical protein B0J12DRAFT_74267 [Macrophomina phaseolina]|uniref:Uncharacterized protein n=1 Tax=Macrophomina phaseolina TaxID=35725 RepID=A0ABQ8GB61_9PEZI|nr:hypothetical protein B0J12DRAFT_74267 [Macrophomina phaseolina]